LRDPAAHLPMITAFGLHEEIGHFPLPALVRLALGHAGAGTLKVLGFEVSHQQSIGAKEQGVVVPASLPQGRLHLRPYVAVALFVFLGRWGLTCNTKQIRFMRALRHTV
jgi:hypothetical protein